MLCLEVAGARRLPELYIGNLVVVPLMELSFATPPGTTPETQQYQNPLQGSGLRFHTMLLRARKELHLQSTFKTARPYQGWTHDELPHGNHALVLL